jgi:TolA-binding protein
MKGRSLVRSGHKTDGAKEFRSVLSQYPRSDSTPKACTELKALGYTCGIASAASKKKKG